MTKIIRPILLAVLIGVILCGASDAATKKSGKPMQETKGAQQKMKTYYMGRFAIDLPAEFKLEIQSQKVRYAEVSDFKWKERDRDKERETLWAQKIAEIKKLKVPKDKKQIIIEEKHLKGIGVWAKAVEYYGDYRIGRYLYWTVFVDYGEAGIWLTLYGLNNDKTIKNFNNILKHYQYGFNDLTKDSFCLNYGRIDIPYMEQESTYARFAGPMGMKLRIEMNETHKVEEAGLLERFTAALATNFAPGVDVDKIRTRKRTLSSLPGQEIIARGTDKMGTDLFFAWDYPGKEDSGEYPATQITIEESEDEHLEEKIKIWDQVLNSFRPAYKR